MDPATHPEPFEQAIGHAAQRSAQLASVVMAAAQVFARYRAHQEQQQAEADERSARALRGQQRADYQQGRLGWAPALDPRWLAQADLPQTARAWGAAAPFAGTDPAAASALRRCEDRLRHLHPYAMARYDRLRGDGMHPIEAMRETVPLFTREPNVRTGGPRTERAALGTGAGHMTAGPPGEAGDSPAAPGPGAAPEDRVERRGRQIVAQLQARARAAGRSELGPDELAIVLETLTNLPEDVIAEVTAADAAASAGRTAAQVAAESFPYPVAEAVAAAHARGPGHAAQSQVRSPSTRQTRPSGRFV